MNVDEVGALSKRSEISLGKLVIVFSSSGQDTVRDTLTPSSTPALSPVSTSPQTLAKNYSLKAVRVWKVVATSQDSRDSIIHRDSATTPVLYAADTVAISLALSARYALYEAKFLTIPDSIASSVPNQPKQALCLDRLVLKVDGAVMRDSAATPGPCFAAGATHALAYDYVAIGTKKTVASTTTQTLYAVDFPTPDTGYAAGDHVSLRTVDGGETWSSTPGADTKVMRGASFINGDKGVIVGGDDSSIVASTTNAGGAWTVTKLSSFNTIRAVHLVNDTGWLAFSPITGSSGSYSYRITLNGGVSWTPTVSLAAAYSIRGVNGTTAWAVGPNGMIRKNTTAAGYFATIQTSGTTRTLRSVFPVDANTVFAVGDTGTILKTTDGGSSWASKTSGTTQNLHAVHFLDATTGFAVGAAGTVVSTSDGGENWVVESSPVTVTLNGLSFSRGRGYAVGDNGTILLLNGPRLIEMSAYGPMGAWDTQNPLYSGSKYINATPGNDVAVPMTLGWTGPTTGVGQLDAQVGKVGKVIVNGSTSGTITP